MTAHLDSATGDRPPTSGLVPLVLSLWPIVAIVTIATLCLGFLIVNPQGLFNRHSDLLAYHLGTQTVLYETWRTTHRLPLWRSDVFSGAPAFANPQSMFTHPFNLLFLVARPERVVGLVIWLQMVLAAVGAYAAGRAIRLTIPGRLAVSVATLFSFKAILLAYAGGLTALSGLAAIPFLFATAAHASERPSLPAALMFGGAGALLLHTGHPQFIYYAFGFVALWCAVTLGRRLLGSDRQQAIAVVGSLVLGGAIAAGLSAYVILPIAHDAPLATRWNSSYETFLGDRPMRPFALLTMIAPETLGTPLDGSFVEAWESVVYFGAVPSLLAITAALQGRRRPYVVALLWGLALTAILGVNSPLTRIAYSVIPGFHLFRLPARVWFLGPFFVACLSGAGLEIVLAAARTPRSRTVIATTLIGLTALEGTYWARRYLMVPEAAPYAQQADYLRSLAGDDALARVASLSRSIPSYGAAAPLGLQLVSGYDPFSLRHYQTFVDLLQYGKPVGAVPDALRGRQPNWTDVRQVARIDMLAALNVQHLVSPAPISLPVEGFELTGSFDHEPQFGFYEGLSTGPVYVYRNAHPLGRAFFVSQVVTAPNEDDEVVEVLKADLRSTAVVTGVGSAGASVAALGDGLQVRLGTPGHLELATRTTNRRFLVVSEVWHPGWHAQIDGQPIAVSRVDIALQGLWVPSGTHRIDLRFWPPWLTAGLLVSGATGMCVVGLCVRFRLRRSDHSHPASEQPSNRLG